MTLVTFHIVSHFTRRARTPIAAGMTSRPSSPRHRHRRHAVLLAALTLSTGCEFPRWLSAIADAATTPAPAATTTVPPTTAPTTTTTTTVATTTTTVPTPAPATTLCASGTAPGPTTPPPGSVTIAVGTEPATITGAHGPGTTYWFAPGTHAATAVIDAQTGDAFLGAPGAVLDGGFLGVPAFKGGGTDVTIRGLTIQRFGTESGHGWVNGAAVNRSVAARWTVEDNTIRLNDGNALFLGDGSVTRRNCFADNGQTGLSAPAQKRNGAYVSLTDVVVTDNDVRGNNRNDLESAPGACRGCTGGMKIWQTTGAVVTGNTVAGNHGVGIWLDNNNVDALVAGNVVDANDREGIMVETSYNTRVVDNDVVGNAVVDGRRRGGSFPVAGIYVSNSGAAPALPGPVGVEIGGNRVRDNWNGVIVFWDADRYCGSAADSSIGHCTLGGATLESCAALVERPDPIGALVDDCHWRSAGVDVHDNEFSMSPALSAGCAGRCGRNGLVATAAPATTTVRAADGSVRTMPNPLAPDWAQARVTDPTSNRFRGNTYSGAWSFDHGAAGQRLTVDQWRAAGHDA